MRYADLLQTRLQDEDGQRPDGGTDTKSALQWYSGNIAQGPN